jgi:putative transposase
MITYIEENKEEYGVEPICRELPIASQTYYAARSRPESKRWTGDKVTAGKIARVHRENCSVYGARKVHAALNREGHRVARCRVERLMRREGLHGVRRAKGPRTTVPGPLSERPTDPVERRFTAPAPDCLWVADITYIRTFSGGVYAAFVMDVFSRRIVGWQLSTSLHTDLALDALRMGIWTRQRAGRDLSQLIHHSDSETVRTGIPGVLDSHSDGRGRMLVPGAPGVLDLTPIDSRCLSPDLSVPGESPGRRYASPPE